MKAFITIVSIFLCVLINAQGIYKVVARDTPYSISKKFGLTLEQFYALNKNVKNNVLSIGDVVVVSNNKTQQITIQRGQSLYGIAREYGVSVADIKKLNPNLGETLQAGQKLNVPSKGSQLANNSQDNLADEKPDNHVTSQPVVEEQSAKTYVVQPRDTYYKITRKYNISKNELLALNPGLEKKGLQSGDTIFIGKDNLANNASSYSPSNNVESNAFSSNGKEVNNEKPDGDSITYIVKSDDTVFGILNKFNLTLDQLLELNPQLAQGLKVGMQLKIRKMGNSYIKSSSDALNVVFLLPFGFDTNDSKYRTAVLDFLTGAKLAIQRNVGAGQKLNINIIDEGSETSFKKALNSINANNTDLIIGPFFKSNVIDLMSYVASKKIPVISPFANSDDLYRYSNLIIVEPDASLYAERIAKEVSNDYNGEKIFILGDNSSYASDIKNLILKANKKVAITVVQNANDIVLDKNLMTGQGVPVIAILASDNESTKTDFVNKVIGLGEEVKGIKAYSMFYSADFDRNEAQLGSVNLVYLMDRKINTDGSFEKEILKDYDNKYCKVPSKYAVVGFDITNDALSREDNKGDIFRQIGKVQTQLATKFQYEKTKEGAYINRGYRVIRINP